MSQSREALLRQHIPQLFTNPGRLLYVGAGQRTQMLPELQAAGHEVVVLEAWHTEDGWVQGDVRQVADLNLGDFDAAFWWHGPEHIEYGELELTLAALEYVADLVVLGCPFGEYEQGPVDGNPYQEHKSTLYPEDFRKWGYRVATLGPRDVPVQGHIMAWRWRELVLPTTIACINAYQEEQMLAGCLESVQGQVDRAVVVDGAYAQFPHEVPWSMDATREIAEAYGAEWIGCTEAWPSQVEKRSAYFVGQESDWYLWIDADERIEGALPAPEDGKHYAIQIYGREGRLGWRPSLFQHRGRMRCEGSHNAVWSDDRLIHLPGAVYVPPEECRFVHLAALRSVERQLQKRSYYGWQKPAEEPYRRAHGI